MNDRQRAAMEASPLYRAFVESGASQRVSRLVSMSYLVASVFNAYAEEAVSIMGQYGMVHKKIKTTSNNLMQSFDAFDKCVFSLITDPEAQYQFCDDFDTFKAVCDRYMNMPPETDNNQQQKHNKQ